MYTPVSNGSPIWSVKRELKVTSEPVKNRSVSCQVLLPGIKMPYLRPLWWQKLLPGQKIRGKLCSVFSNRSMLNMVSHKKKWFILYAKAWPELRKSKIWWTTSGTTPRKRSITVKSSSKKIMQHYRKSIWKPEKQKPWIFQPPVTYFNSSWPTVAKSPFVLPVPNPK